MQEGDNRNSADLSENVVKILTVYQSKGIDAKYTFIIGFDDMCQNNDSTINEENNNNLNSKYPTTSELGYVSLTRALEHCYIYYVEKNEIINLLDNLLIEFSS